MAGKARTRKTYGTKLKDQQVNNKTLYTISNQGTVMQATNSIISGGSVSSGNVEWVKVAQEDLNMNTYDINNVDRLRFATSEGAGDALTTSDYGMEALYSGTNAYGIQIRVPSAKSIYLRSGGTALATFDDQNGFVTGMGIIGGNLSTLGVVDFDNIVSPSNPATNHVKLFADSDNSNHLTVRKSDGSEVDLETSSSSWVGTATSDLNMATYDITNICRLEFDPAGSTLANSTTGIDATATKMHFNVADSSDYFEFTANGTERLFVGTTQIKWRNASGDALEIMNDLIPDTDDDFDLGSSSNEWKDLYLDGIAYIDTVSASTISVTTFSTTGTSNLGDGDTDQVNFYGKTDWKTNVTSSSATTGSREGYITIKINGTDKKLYYYA